MKSIILILIIFLSFWSCKKSPGEAYRNAEKTDTIEGYQLFLDNYPKSEFSQKAKKKIAKKIFRHYVSNCKEKAKHLEKASYDDCRRVVRVRAKFNGWYSDSDYDFYITSFQPLACGELIMADENTFYFCVSPLANSECKGERHGKVAYGLGRILEFEYYLLSFKDNNLLIVKQIGKEQYDRSVHALGGSWDDWVIDKEE
jgi:hypothetical protein